MYSLIFPIRSFKGRDATRKSPQTCIHTPTCRKKTIGTVGQGHVGLTILCYSIIFTGSLLQEQKIYLWHFQVLAACKTDWKLYAIEDNGTSGFYSSLVSWLGRVLLCLSAV